MTLKKNNSDQIEVINVTLNERDHPETFEKKKKELIKQGMNEEEARKDVEQTTFEMELYYSEDQGLFMVESEAIDSCDIWNPYDGELMEEHEEEI